MKLLVYLIGQITENPITYQWRRDLREELCHWSGFNEKIGLIDPCNNGFSLDMLREASDSDVDFALNVTANQQHRLFPAIDKRYVKKDSDACIFNANHYSPETPFVGTIFELAWYHDHPWKPVIGVFDGNPFDDYFCRHPFVHDTVHTWVQTPTDALALLGSLLHR